MVIVVSEWLPLSKGVQQGSISRPSIFNIFINEFCWLFEELLANYADNSNLSVILDEVQEVKAVLEKETVKQLNGLKKIT